MPLFARIDPEIVVWGIVFIFWVIAQIIAKVKEFQTGESGNRGRPVARDAAGEPAVEDELREFLESLTGYAEEEEEDHEEWHPKPKVQIDPAPAPEPVIHFDPTPPPPPPVVQTDSESTEDDASYAYKGGDFEAIKEIEDIVETVHLGHESAVTGSSLIKMDTIKMMTVPIPVMRTAHQEHQVKPPKFKNRKAFQDAIISQVVLGPCKAIETPQQQA